MPSSLERLPKSRVRLSIEVPQATVQKAVDEAYTSLSSQVEIKGFRKGQAPRPLIYEAVGLDRLRETVLQKLLPQTYFDALQREKLVPVTGPEVNIKSAEWEKSLPQGQAASGLSYQAEVDTLPKVKLTKDYQSIRVKKPAEPEVTEEEVNAVLDHLRRQQADFKDVNRPARDGDRIEIDFEGQVNHVQRPEFSSENYPILLGSQTLLPGFEKELLGTKKGEQKNFRLEVPTKADPTKKEKVDFKVTVRDVKEMILPEPTDEFARKVGQDSLLALRGAIRQSLRQNKAERTRRDTEQTIAEELVKSSEVDLPESLVHQEVHRMIETLQHQAEQYGMPWEAYLANLKKSEEDLHRDFAAQAEKTVKFGLVLGYIMTQEKIDPKSPEAGRQAMDRLIKYATSQSI